VLSPQDYKLFSLHYIKMILNHLPSSIPTILFSPSGYISLECIADSGCHAVGLDWRMDLKNVKQHIGHRVTLQGNLDPAVLLATPKVIREKAQALLDIYRYETGYIFNLGHGVLPNTPIENVAALVETVIRQN